MTLNRHLIYQTYQQIKACPEAFDMGIWGDNYKCRTVACFAGHATLIDGSGYYYDGMLCNTGNHDEHSCFLSRLALEALGLPDSHLFYLKSWPDYIQKMYFTNPVEALRQAIMYFTHYDPEFSLEQGDSLPEGEVVLFTSLDIQKEEV